GATMLGNSGLLSWTPAASDLGDHVFAVSVDDGRGGVEAQTFTVTVHVSAEIHGAVIDSQPGAVVKVNVPNIPASASPYLAGMPDGAGIFAGDSSPGQSPVQVLGLPLQAGRDLAFTNVTGLTSFSPFDPMVGPDGFPGTGEHGD